MKEGKRIKPGADYICTGSRVREGPKEAVGPILRTGKALSYLINENKNSNKKIFLQF
jgi:hypothetical protein